jgi:hypothetical protein
MFLTIVLMMYVVWDLDITTSYHRIDRDFCTSLAQGYLVFVMTRDQMKAVFIGGAIFGWIRIYTSRIMTGWPSLSSIIGCCNSSYRDGLVIEVESSISCASYFA